jgi:hypothetical protein
MPYGPPPYLTGTTAKLILSVFALTGASWYVILRNASSEPYLMFRWPDAVEQVGLGISVCLAWICLFIFICRGVALERLTLWWLLLLPLAVATFYLVQFAANGYIEDLRKFT